MNKRHRDQEDTRGSKKKLQYLSQSVLEAVKSKFSLDLVKEIIDNGGDVNLKDGENKTALMYANDLAMARMLISAGADINAVDSNGFTVLMHAVKQKCEKDFIEHLIKLKVDISVFNKAGDNAMLLACDADDHDTVQLLLNSGSSLYVRNKNGESLLMVAARQVSCNVLRVLLSAGAKIHDTDSNNETALFKAQTTESCLILLAARASVTNVNTNAETPLMHFVSKKPYLLDCIKLLLKFRANPLIQDCDGNTTLIEACNHPGHLEHLTLVKLLLEKGVNPSAQNKNGHCALSQAIVWGHVQIMKLLLKSGANPSSANVVGESLLMQLCRYKIEDENILEILLKAGANVSVQNNNSKTVLMLAVKYNHFKYVKLLLQYGANSCVQDDDGNTALHHIFQSENDQLELVKMLLENGGNLSIQNNQGETAIMIALQKFHIFYESVGYILDVNRTFNYCGRNIVDGRNLLMMACRSEDIYASGIAKILQTSGSLSAQDKKGLTAPMLVLKRILLDESDFEIIEMLIKAGSSVCTQDNNGNTLLMMACERGLMDVVIFLLKNGACVSTQNTFGETAASIAASKNYFNIVFLLLKNGGSAVNTIKNSSVITEIFKNQIEKTLSLDFKTTLRKVISRCPVETHPKSLLIYELVKAFVMYYTTDNIEDVALFTKVVIRIVEKFSSADDDDIFMPHRVETHAVLMTAMSQNPGFNFCRLKPVFDSIMKSPFKNVNYTYPCTASITGFFEKHSYAKTICEITDLSFDTIGYLFYTLQHSLQSISKEKFEETLVNMLDNGFSLTSDNPKVISPLSVLICAPRISVVCSSSSDESCGLQITKLLLDKGVSKSQRLLRCYHEDHAVLSQQLQLPDALWLALLTGNSTVLTYLLPYWSSPPLALLLFLPPLRRHDELTRDENSYFEIFNKMIFYKEVKQILKQCFPILSKIGGPLPPQHEFIQRIQTYLKKFSKLKGKKILRQFKKLHSEVFPSLTHLCRHVYRGSALSGDDLPERLTSSPRIPPGLRAYLTLTEH